MYQGGVCVLNSKRKISWLKVDISPSCTQKPRANAWSTVCVAIPAWPSTIMYWTRYASSCHSWSAWLRVLSTTPGISLFVCSPVNCNRYGSLFVWLWISTKKPRKDTNIVKLTGPYTRYVSRTLYRGYYLPGWWMADGQNFRAADPVTINDKKCKYGEFLAFPDPSSYWWIPYTAGDSLPDCALPVSELPDGTPLYIVRYGSDSIAGFYHPLTKSTYFVYWGVVNPTAVEILCGTGA